MRTEKLKSELANLERMLSLIPTESNDDNDRVARAIFITLINDTRKRLASDITSIIDNPTK